MDFMDIKEKFQVEDNELTFENLVNEVEEEIADDIKESDVVILPSHGTKDAFYTGSLDILDYLNENKIKTYIYATDEKYKELGLHSDEIWLGTFFVKNIVIPIFCSVIASYIYEKLKAKSDDKVSLRFIIEKKNGNTASVSFDGKVDDLKKALDAAKEFSDEI